METHVNMSERAKARQDTSYKTSRLQEFPETVEVLCCSVLQCVAVCCSRVL